MRILPYAEFLFEGEYQNFSERKKELVSYLKNKNYKNYIQTLNDMLKDPKLRALVEDGFGGELGDIQLDFSEQVIDVDKLDPTQNEIGLTQSLDYGLKSTKNFVKYFEPFVEIKHPLVTLNRKYVIDGHHRWSEILCFNPKAKVVCINYDGNITPIEMLKITQGAIAATKGEIESHEKHGENLSVTRIKELSIALKVDPLWLMGFTEEKHPKDAKKLLLYYYDSLNQEGKETLIKTAKVMVQSGEYIKSHKPSMVESEA